MRSQLDRCYHDAFADLPVDPRLHDWFLTIRDPEDVFTDKVKEIADVVRSQRMVLDRELSWREKAIILDYLICLRRRRNVNDPDTDQYLTRLLIYFHDEHESNGAHTKTSTVDALLNRSSVGLKNDR